MPKFLVEHTEVRSGEKFVVVDLVNALTKELAFESECDYLADKIASGEVAVETIKVLNTVTFQTIPKIDFKDFKKEKDNVV